MTLPITLSASLTTKIQCYAGECDKVVIDQLYEVCNFLACGTFGQLRLGRNIRTSEPVAIKIEKAKDTTRKNAMHSEYVFYKLMGPSDKVAHIFYAGSCNEHRVLVMELLGLSLDNLFDICNRHFSLKTTCMIALRLLDIFEFVHNKGIVHRDIKPQNFCIGRHISQQHEIRIVDFGLAKEYIDRTSGGHVALGEDSETIVGTPAFLSLNAHLAERQSRRDDLESLGFMLIYLMQGSLPWTDQPRAAYKELLTKVAKIKMSIPFPSLCAGLPDEFVQFMEYTRNLDYFETPDYGYLSKIWSNLANKRSFEDDRFFDWTPRLNLIASNSIEDSAPNTPRRFVIGSTNVSEIESCMSSIELSEPPRRSSESSSSSVPRSRILVRQDKHLSGAESADERAYAKKLLEVDENSE